IPLNYFIAADYDRPEGVSCLSDHCAGGDTSSDHTVLIVGDSHSAQWFDVLDHFGTQEGFKVLTRLGDVNLAQVFDETTPDVVVTVSTRTTENSFGNEERVRDMTYDLVGAAQDGIQVVGI